VSRSREASFQEINDALVDDRLDFLLQGGLEVVALDLGVVQEEVETLDFGILFVM
jgi:hypothetical protein